MTKHFYLTKPVRFFTSLAVFTAVNSLPALAQMNHHSGHDMNNAANMRSAHMIEIIANVKGIKIKDGKITLAHGMVPEINWPPMTMDFPVGSNIDLRQFKVGDTVQFTLHRAQDGSLPLVEICNTNSDHVQPGLCAPKAPNSNMKTRPNHSAPQDIEHSQHQGH